MKKGLVFLFFSCLMLSSNAVAQEDDIKLLRYYEQAKSNLNPGETLRSMEVALLLRDQGMLTDAYSQAIFSYQASTGIETQTRLLFTAGLLAYEMSNYQNPNSYAWRMLLKDYPGKVLTKQAWKILEKHYKKEDMPSSIRGMKQD